MTTTCQNILDRAGRSMGVTAAGGAMAGNDVTDAMEQLQDIINDLPLLRDGEWCEVFLTSAAAYTASDGERIHTEGFAAVITLPLTYVDECGRTRATLDCSRVQILGADHAQVGLWVYSASLGSWSQVDALTIGDDSPFGPEDDAGLAALVAVAMVTEFGAEVSDVVVTRAQRCQAGFRARFYREVVVGLGDEFLIGANLGNGAQRSPNWSEPA